MPPLLSAIDLTRRFGAREALSGLSFVLERGEVLGLLGPNGAGKTTCLQVLSGNLAPSRGRLLIDDIDLHRHPLRVKGRIGYLPERAPIYPEMRVDEYLDFAARLRRLPGYGVAGAVERVKQRCGLGQVGRRLLGRLSKGYRQRAGLAAALVHDPDLVILDEPTDGLDPVQVREVRDLVRDLARTCGLIVSSHALAEVQALCSRVIILRDGRELHRADLSLDAAAGPRYFLRLTPPPALDTLRGLAPVASAEVAGADGFQVALMPGAGPAELARLLVERGFGLLELGPRRSDLERVFFQAIGAEAPA